jgi:hypothetical protein
MHVTSINNNQSCVDNIECLFQATFSGLVSEINGEKIMLLVFLEGALEVPKITVKSRGCCRQ